MKITKTNASEITTTATKSYAWVNGVGTAFDLCFADLEKVRNGESPSDAIDDLFDIQVLVGYNPDGSDRWIVDWADDE